MNQNGTEAMCARARAAAGYALPSPVKTTTNRKTNYGKSPAAVAPMIYQKVTSIPKSPKNVEAVCAAAKYLPASNEPTAKSRTSNNATSVVGHRNATSIPSFAMNQSKRGAICVRARAFARAASGYVLPSLERRFKKRYDIYTRTTSIPKFTINGKNTEAMCARARAAAGYVLPSATNPTTKRRTINGKAPAVVHSHTNSTPRKSVKASIIAKARAAAGYVLPLKKSSMKRKYDAAATVPRAFTPILLMASNKKDMEAKCARAHVAAGYLPTLFVDSILIKRKCNADIVSVRNHPTITSIPKSKIDNEAMYARARAAAGYVPASTKRARAAAGYVLPFTSRSTCNKGHVAAIATIAYKPKPIPQITMNKKEIDTLCAKARAAAGYVPPSAEPQTKG